MNMEKNNLPDHGEIPDIGIRWSKKRVVFTFLLIVIIAGLGVLGVFMHQERQQKETEGLKLPPRLLSKNQKIYTNDYWGFSFTYPGDWWPIIGSVEEGDYFFSSENINFISELSEGQALLEVMPFHNLKKLTFTDWLTDREQNYFPAGTVISSNAIPFTDREAKEYVIELKKPTPAIGAWDMVIISQDTTRKYIFILKAKDLETLKRYNGLYRQLLESIKFYNGFGS
jgi:hypothetical protein